MFYVETAFSRSDNAKTYLYKCFNKNIKVGDCVVMERNARTKNTTRPIKFDIGWVKNVLTKNEALEELQALDGVNILEVVDKVDFSEYNLRKKEFVVCGDTIHIDISKTTIQYLLEIRYNKLLKTKTKKQIVDLYSDELNELEDVENPSSNIICAKRIYKTAINVLKK